MRHCVVTGLTTALCDCGACGDDDEMERPEQDGCAEDGPGDWAA